MRQLSARSRDIAHQLRGVDVEGVGEVEDDGEGGDVFAAFEEADVADAQVGALGEGFLG